jgi:hypothetical protein
MWHHLPRAGGVSSPEEGKSSDTFPEAESENSEPQRFCTALPLEAGRREGFIPVKRSSDDQIRRDEVIRCWCGETWLKSSRLVCPLFVPSPKESFDVCSGATQCMERASLGRNPSAATGGVRWKADERFLSQFGASCAVNHRARGSKLF